MDYHASPLTQTEFDFSNHNQNNMKPYLLAVFTFLTLSLVACSTAQEQAAVAAASQVATLATQPTANGEPIDQVVAEQILSAWHIQGPKTTAITNVGAVLLNGAIIVGKNELAAGATKAQAAAAQTTYINDPNVQAAAAKTAVVPDVLAVTVPTPNP